nr:MAG TPA: hypothetical protein [Caudoviricetes sp.]
MLLSTSMLGLVRMDYHIIGIASSNPIYAN